MKPHPFVNAFAANRSVARLPRTVKCAFAQAGAREISA